MPELTAVILASNEEIHIERCLRSLRGVAGRMFIVDSFSTDRTVELARALGAQVVQHAYSYHADQLQWALDNLEVGDSWILRLDADEYLEPRLQAELRALFMQSLDGVDGMYVNRKMMFRGQWMRFGGSHTQATVRIWRAGTGRLEQRRMDAHLIMPVDARIIRVRGSVVDDNLKGISVWTDKHNRYAAREAAQHLIHKYHLLAMDDRSTRVGDYKVRLKRVIKDRIYAKAPLGWRAFVYFVARYVFLLGFLDGSNGFFWHLLQGLWYRLLVDLKIMEIEKQAKGNPQETRRILREVHGIAL